VPTLGGRVQQFYALLEDVPLAGTWGSGKATVWAEYFDQLAPDTEVVLRYGAGNDWLTNQPAAISRKVGKGTITYLGAVLDPALMASVAKQWITAAGVTLHTLPAPAGVSVSRRVGPDREVYVITNFSSGAQEIVLPRAMTDVLHGGEVSFAKLPRYGVSVLSSLAAPAKTKP
jgi:beta-galactosidase